ncbi:hypothetical protein BH20ACT15_BH20ACT15_05080 [soil metagenome]
MPPELRLPDSPRGGSFRGREAIREYVTTFHHSWSEVHFELRDVVVLGEGDRVLTLGALHTRGLGSGIEIDTPIANLIEIKDGRIIRQKDYWDHVDALAAAELDPGAYAGLA